MMRLYHSPTSPFVRKVMVFLHESGLLSETELVGVAGTPTDPGSMPVGLNPLGKIPALVVEEGHTLYDSRVICRYLDTRAKAGLYPEGDALWDTLVIEATADGIMEAAVLMVYETRLRPEEARFAPWVEGQWLKIARALDALETRHMATLDHGFGAAQIATACALGYLDFRHGDRNWRAGRPLLAAWAQAVLLRPALAESAPPG